MNTFLTLDRAHDGRYTLRLNSSLLKTADCLRQVMYRAFYGLSKPSDMWKADYGSAVHRALQSYYGNRRLEGKEHGQVVAEARQAGLDYYADVFVPEDDWRNTAHLSATLNGYFKEYASDELEVELVGDKPQLERTFEILYYEDEFCMVYIVGTVDMSAIWQGSRVMVDTKTTGRWQYTGNPEKWLETFSLSNQLGIYKWADQKQGKVAENCLINGVLLFPKKPSVFVRRLFPITDEHVACVMRGVDKHVKELVRDLKWMVNGHDSSVFPFDKNTTQCECHFGCPFTILCLANNPMHEAELITSGFDRKMYDPRRLQEEI